MHCRDGTSRVRLRGSLLDGRRGLFSLWLSLLFGVGGVWRGGGGIEVGSNGDHSQNTRMYT